MRWCQSYTADPICLSMRVVFAALARRFVSDPRPIGKTCEREFKAIADAALASAGEYDCVIPVVVVRTAPGRS